MYNDYLAQVLVIRNDNKNSSIYSQDYPLFQTKHMYTNSII